MRLIKVGAAVLNQTPLDWTNNRQNILAAIKQAQSSGVSILCLPELCISGYGCEDSFQGLGVQRESLRSLFDIVPATANMIVSVGLALNFQNSLFNTACLLVDGKIAGFVAKRFLAGDGIYYEPRWFKPWPEGQVASVEIDGNTYPLGDIHFDCGGVRIGFEICEDAWVAKRPGSDLALQGVDLILNPSASHFAFGKFEVRKRFVLEGSRAFGLSYVYSNHLGNESGRAIYDGGALIASGGKLLASGPRFSYQSSCVTSATIDIDATRNQQTRSGSLTPQVDEPKNRIKAPFTFRPIPQQAISPQHETTPPQFWEQSPHLKEEEFCRAVALGLFDYLRKSRCRGFVVSLSGGADSAAVSCLTWLMVEFGSKELGHAGFVQKIGRSDLEKASSSKDIMKGLLTCIYQASANSSATTRKAAREVAHAVGAEFLEFNVTNLIESYVALVSDQLQRPLRWDTDDLALQNIQARVRSPGAWLVANVKNFLLLVTSNRSEAAVGYTTMDGDTSGALCPIGGIDKAFLLHWIAWLEKQGPEAVGALPVLSVITAQRPTAELRPPDQQQTDESDLMPYAMLDLIERAAILDKLTPIEIFQRLQSSHPQYDSNTLGLWLERFFTLWCRNQWKRERFAPAFHLDDESLDPKTWCRFPILSGGFQEELKQLRDYIQKLKQ